VASAAVGALALSTAFATTAGPVAAAPDKPSVVSLFPSNSLTVPDASQLTERRVALPQGTCLPVTCGLLNQLDGFDLDPRLAVRFSGKVDAAAAAGRITVEQVDGPFRTGVDRVVFDPTTNTVYAHPAQQLAPSTTYRLRVQGGPANKAARDSFTTMSATDGLLDLREQIESGSAFEAAGITDRGLEIDGVFPSAGTSVTLVQDQGATSTAVPVPPLYAAGGATFVFGSYLAPSWLTDEVAIPQTPTRDGGPVAKEGERVPFVAVLPAGAAPAGGWPVAVFGHGFTRSTYDVFLAAGGNLRAGLATIATNVVGHGYGPDSTWQVSRGGRTTSLPSHGRGVDQNGDGVIGSTEGSSASGASIELSSRDALRQTAADVMTLVRAVGGTDVDNNGFADLGGTDVTYFGQSFGGIYGTMVAGADPTVARSVLNVPGGPITEIARTSPSFRGLITLALQRYGLLNSADPSRFFFQEQLPLRGEGPVTASVPGALAIQDYLAQATWLARPGSPETFSPLIPDEKVLVQVAFGDQTVPNPTSYTLVAAGGLFERTSVFRNDKTATAGVNPHGFLLFGSGPVPGAQGQAQVAAFLGAGQVVDPDGPGDVWEVPVEDPATLLPLNFTNPALRP
jgi:hypothetical protein